MSDLKTNAATAEIMPIELVESVYRFAAHDYSPRTQRLCESHERLRMELAAAECLIAESQKGAEQVNEELKELRARVAELEKKEGGR